MPATVDFTFLRSRAALRRMALWGGLAGLVGLAYGLVAPKWYRSSVTVVPAKQQRSSISSMLGGDLGGLVAGLDGGAGADINRIAAVLESNDVSDAVIDKLKLRERYGEPVLENAREALWKHCDLRVLPKPGLVQLSCEDKDPNFARDMVGFFAEHGNQVFRRVSVGSAAEEVRAMDARVLELRRLAQEQAQRLREFQELHHLVDLETQARAVVGTMATLNSQRVLKQLELDLVRTYAAPDEPNRRQLESEISVYDARLRALEAATAPAPALAPVAGAAAPSPGDRPRGAASGLFPPAMDVPRLRSEYEGLYRDRKVAEASLIFALERLEGAKASEARDVSTFQVLDTATPATRHARPRALRLLAIGLALGILAAVARERWGAPAGRAG